jgi:hypothetical protein
MIYCRSARVCEDVKGPWQKDCDVSEILLALCDVAFVAGLILLADETVRRATSQRFAFDIGAGATDLILDVCPNLLRRSNGPAFTAGIDEEPGKLGVVLTFAAELRWPGPVAQCLEGLGDSLLKVTNAHAVVGRASNAGPPHFLACSRRLTAGTTTLSSPKCSGQART